MSVVIVAGALANKPFNGGEAWVRLNWILGFRRLGFEVHFLEEIKRATCIDSPGRPCAFPDCANLAFFRQVTDQFGLSGSATLVYENGEQTHGRSHADLLELAETADLLLNISGHLASEALLKKFRRKAYIDIDPGFTQFWHADPNTTFKLRGHDYYFTIGENIGSPDCHIPTGGIRWRPIRQPVVLEDWPVAAARERMRFTTVASWRGSYGPVQFGGRNYGLKVHEFRKVLPLPRRVRGTEAKGPVFEIALDIHPADARDLAALRENGWHVADPRAVAGDPAAFRRYVQGSGAEFSVAQGIYAETNSGWFSDRSVRYLASGKPVLVQDTGFGRNLPAGEGLVPFRTLEEAIDGAERITRDYERHCRAARAIAEDCFDSDRVLGKFLEEVGVAT
jgi:hypothetical protein